MEFKTAMRILKRMCSAHESCVGCPMNDRCHTSDMMNCPDTIEAILTKWAEEYPEKTIADDFFEKFPKAKRDDDGMPTICAMECGYLDECPKVTCSECWRTSLDEVKA